MVIFNLDPLGYVEQLRAGEMQAIPPLLALMAISGLFAGVLEVLTGRSLGKWLVELLSTPAKHREHAAANVIEVCKRN